MSPKESKKITRKPRALRGNAATNAGANSKWAELTFRKMTLEEKLGQLVMVYCWGRFTSAEDDGFRELLRRVRENHVGGIILEAKRTPAGLERSQVCPTAMILNQLQKAAKIPLFAAADFESGTAMRLAEGTSFPSAMAVAATGERSDAYTVGKVTALEARAAGLNWIFAPDADVNSNPENPIINIRSYGEDPERVAEFVTEFVRGAQDNGVLATVKHFPGHGDVSTDSHLSLPVVSGDAEKLNRAELVPFRAAIAAGVGAVMPGHLSVPALEPDPNVPATLSRRILTDLLRKKLGFKGLAVTDALDMGGVTTIDSPPNVAVRAVQAGIDVLLLPPHPDAAMAALKTAVESGRLPMARVNEAVRRILRAKAALGLNKTNNMNLNALKSAFASPESRDSAQDIADRGITLLRDGQTLLPLDATRPLRVLLLIVSGDPDVYPGAALEQKMRERIDSIQIVRVDTQFSRAMSASLPSRDSYDVAIVAVLVRVADRKGTVGLPEEEIALIERLLETGKPAVVACLGSPYLMSRFASAQTWIGGFGTQDAVQRAMVRAIFGQIPTQGRMPVGVPGIAKTGEGIRMASNPMTLAEASGAFAERLEPAIEIANLGVVEGAFPGGVLAVGHRRQCLVHPFGRFTYDAKSSRVEAGTIYDVASLTKPLATTAAVMLLVAQGRLDLKEFVSNYLPEWSETKKGEQNAGWGEKVSVADLLLHSSGLPAHREFFKIAKNKGQVLRCVFAEPLIEEPGKRIEYSDLGFILLGEIVERLTGETLDHFVSKNIFEPLGMAHTFFNPPRALRSQIAPTERDSVFRGRQLQGEVDDANAYAMGGVAGHAGLFSTGGDAAVFAQLMLNGGIHAHHRIFPRPIVEQFTAREKIGDSARALGWDVPTDNSSSGRYFSRRSFGHTGFTGTSIWIDPEKDLFVILLTNRVYPSAANERVREVRPALHNAVVESLGLVPERAAR